MNLTTRCLITLLSQRVLEPNIQHLFFTMRNLYAARSGERIQFIIKAKKNVNRLGYGEGGQDYVIFCLYILSSFLLHTWQTHRKLSCLLYFA